MHFWRPISEVSACCENAPETMRDSFDCSVCPRVLLSDKLTQLDWAIIRIYQAVGAHTVRAPIPGDSKKESVLLDKMAVLSTMKIFGVPSGMWDHVAECLEFLFALQHGGVDLDRYPAELLNG